MRDRYTDPHAWRELSSSLDELLQLEPEERDRRLAILRQSAPALADDLAALLDRLAPLDDEGFLAAPALPPPAGLAGQAVGAYVLQRQIGQGGMGSVWLARRADGRYDGHVAIKFMQRGLLAPGAADRFLREGQLLARLNHPHIAKLLDAGITSAASAAAGQPYLVLEHIEGLPIDRHCDARALDARARVSLMWGVADAVAHAHSRLILHRDLKPSNILVTPDGQPKLLDFGIGKLLDSGDTESADVTQATQVAFTARYAAPEQVQRLDVTTATDVYALGVLLYGLLGGGHPTEPADKTPLAQMKALVDAVPLSLSEAVRRRGGASGARQARALRGDIDTIVGRALKKQPAERYPNAAALAEDLRRWLDHEPVLARRDNAGYRIGRFVRRHRQAVVAAGTAGTLALAGGASLALWQAQQARSERSQAEALVEFMLGDLQQKLNGLGRTDLLQAVGARALAYYRDKPLELMDRDALARHARALRVIGESARQRMDWDQAKAALDRAAATTGRLVTLEPDNIARLQDHASSLERQVELTDRVKDERDTLALTRQLSALRWQAAALAPDDPALQLQALEGNQWVASMLNFVGDASDSVALLQRGQVGLEALPKDLKDLARVRFINLGLLGQALVAGGRYAEAEIALRSALAQQDLQPDTKVGVWQRREDRNFLSILAQVMLNQGQVASAVVLAKDLVTRLSAESEVSLDNRLITENAIQDRTFLAELLRLSGARQQAREQLQLIEDALARMPAPQADDLRWHLRTVGDVLALRMHLCMREQPLSADPALMAALLAHEAHLARADAQGLRLSGSLRRVVLTLGLLHGDALQAQGQTEQARQRWQAVAQRALPVAQDGAHVGMQHLAQALLRLGQPEQARPWVELMLASEWRHPDLADLQRELVKASGLQRQEARAP